MSKTNLLPTLFLLFCCFPLSAINHYEVGDTLYACARSGLGLRISPHKNSAIITTIPYGAFITTKDTKEAGGDYSVEIEVQTGWLCYSGPTDSIGKKQITLKGRWAKIDYQGQEGYVFDGFLSHWPAVKYTMKTYQSMPKNITTPQPENIITYLNRHYECLDSMRIFPKVGPAEILSQRIYKGGIMVLGQGSTKFTEDTWVFPGMSLEEAYLMVNVLESLDIGLLATNLTDEFQMDGRWEKDKLEVTTGENTWFSVRVIGGVCIFLFNAED